MSQTPVSEIAITTAEEGIAQVNQNVAQQLGSKQWRWMGNYGSVYDMANVANQAPGVEGPVNTTALAQMRWCAESAEQDPSAQ
jgi:hypothetical protein